MQSCFLLSNMASKFISAFVFTLVLFCFLLMCWETSACGSVHACFDANEGSLKKMPNRKMLSALKEKKSSLKDSLEGTSRNKPLIGELRKVPTGPDPLHHHSIGKGNPIRPETP